MTSLSQGRRPEQNRHNQILFIIGVVGLVITLLILIATRSSAQPTTGYLVAVEQLGHKTQITQTQDAELVNRIVAKVLKNNCFDVETVLHNSLYVDYRVQTTCIYIEKKSVVNGKYKRYKKSKGRI